MEITKETVEKLSQLAKIALQPEEVERLQGNLQDIFRFIDQLDEIQLDDTPETMQVTGLNNVMRPDENVLDYDRDEMLATMPETDEDGHLSVHAVFTGDSPSH